MLPIPAGGQSNSQRLLCGAFAVSQCLVETGDFRALPFQIVIFVMAKYE
jgi:hypothetical protein